MMKALAALVLLLCSGALEAAPMTRTILVFPFENRSASADLGWISEAFAQEMSRRLAGPGRFVLGRDDLNGAYKQSGIPPDATLTLASEYKVAATLGVDWAIIGSFKVAGYELNAEAQVLDLPHLRLYPAIRESGPLSDLIGIQTQIAWTILKTYDHAFAGESEAAFARRFPPVRLNAFEDYIRGILAQDSASKIEFLSTAARLNPADHRPDFALGRYYFLRRDYATSALWLRKLDSRDSRYLNSLFFMGVDDFFLGHNRQAEECFQTLSAEIPLSEVWNNLGVLEARRGDYSDALVSFQRSHGGDPTDAIYSYNLGACYCDLRRYQESIPHLEAALAQNPENLNARTLLAYALTRLGDAHGSQAQLAWVSEHDGKAMADLNASILPQPRIKKSFNGEAFRLLEVTVRNSLEAQLSKLPPQEHGQVHLVRGERFIRQSRLPEAISELQEAVSLMPESSVAHLFLGQAYEEHGDHEKAIVQFQASLRLYDSATTHLWLAHAYLSLHQLPQALDESQTALSLDPGNADAERLIDSVQQRMKTSERKP